MVLILLFYYQKKKKNYSNCTIETLNIIKLMLFKKYFIITNKQMHDHN